MHPDSGYIWSFLRCVMLNTYVKRVFQILEWVPSALRPMRKLGAMEFQKLRRNDPAWERFHHQKE